MKDTTVDIIKFRQAIKQFESLEKAIEHQKSERASLHEYNQSLKRENASLVTQRSQLLQETGKLNESLDELRKQVQQQSELMEQCARQYGLFEAFVAMLLTSPSRTCPLETLISCLKGLADANWTTDENVDDLRTLFVCSTMGAYLKCFRCEKCGASFITNRQPYYEIIEDRYECPTCHSARHLRADDSFLGSMLGDEQLEAILWIRKLHEENQAMEALKAFLLVPCEICNEPITEWTAENVLRAYKGYGWAHHKCWDTPPGMSLLIDKVKKRVLG